ASRASRQAGWSSTSLLADCSSPGDNTIALRWSMGVTSEGGGDCSLRLLRNERLWSTGGLDGLSTVRLPFACWTAGDGRCVSGATVLKLIHISCEDAWARSR